MPKGSRGAGRRGESEYKHEDEHGHTGRMLQSHGRKGGKEKSGKAGVIGAGKEEESRKVDGRGCGFITLHSSVSSTVIGQGKGPGRAGRGRDKGAVMTATFCKPVRVG